MLEMVVPEVGVAGAGGADGLALGAGGGAGFEVEGGVDEPDVAPEAGGVAAAAAGAVVVLAEGVGAMPAPPQPEMKIVQLARAEMPIDARGGNRISQF
jgi:hypothetical protein